MNFLTKTADITAGYVFGAPYKVVKSLATLPRARAVKQIATDLVIKPAIDIFTLNLPLIRPALSASGWAIGSCAKKITKSWISYSVQNAVHRSLPKPAPRASEEDTQLLHGAIMKQLQPLVISNSAKTVQRIATDFGVGVLAGTLCGSAEDLVLSKFSRKPAATLKTTVMNAVLASGIYTMVDQVRDRLLDEPYSDEQKQQLKDTLREKLLSTAEKDPLIPENLRSSLLRVMDSVADTIVENPLTDLSKLESLLTTKSALRSSFFTRLFQEIISFFQGLYEKIFRRSDVLVD